MSMLERQRSHYRQFGKLQVSLTIFRRGWSHQRRNHSLRQDARDAVAFKEVVGGLVEGALPSRSKVPR